VTLFEQKYKFLECANRNRFRESLCILLLAFSIHAFSGCQEIPQDFTSYPTSVNFGYVPLGVVDSLPINFINTYQHAISSAGARVSTHFFQLSFLNGASAMDTTLVYIDQQHLWVLFSTNDTIGHSDTLRILGSDTSTTLLRIPLFGRGKR